MESLVVITKKGDEEMGEEIALRIMYGGISVACVGTAILLILRRGRK